MGKNDDSEINLVIAELQKQASSMDHDSEEYSNIQKILRVTQWKKMDFVKCVGKHLAAFSEGVLASVVATVLMK